jgi:hypothetical protein
MTRWVESPAEAVEAEPHDLRPDGAGEVVARGGDGDGDAAPPVEPEGDMGEERAEGGRRAEADEQAVRQGEDEDRGSPSGGQHIADAEQQAAADHGAMMPNRSEIRPISDAAAGKAQHGQRVGQRGLAAPEPKSACTAGITTTTDHMPTPPIVPSASATARRSQAARPSMSEAGEW